MGGQARILAFAGSLRQDSYNKRLARAAAAAAADAGAQTNVIDLRDFPLPIFDEDLEREATPAAAIELKRLLVEHQGFLIASPEYNSSITAALKNAIDWASRPADNEPPLVAFQGKTAALLSASPGALGGLRGLVHVRSILSNIGVFVLPDQLAIPNAHEAFNGEELTHERHRGRVAAIAKKLADVTARLN